MEPGLDVLGVNFLKYVKKLNCLVHGEVVKNCNIILFFNQYLLSFMWWVALAQCLLNGLVVLCFVLSVH